MSSDDCLRVWDALAQHVRADFDAENQVAPSVRCSLKGAHVADVRCYRQETLAVIDAICSFGCAYLKAVPKQAPESLQAIVQTLHDSLLRVEFESDVQDTMSRLCEAWYLAEPESRRHVVPQTILYLLLHSVGEKGKLADVKRVCAMREALLCIHIGGESFQSVQESFMRAAIHPNYVMHDEGRRFLAFVLSLQPQLTRALHQTIKSQLPRCRKSMLLQYGELYHTAWKRATGPVLHALEHDCLQDLASHAINTASPALSAAIRHLLSVFHNKKKFKAVDEMLARIYEPILWRSFKVANAAIRVQAAQLLAEAFPVQNPEASAKDFEEGLTRQIAVLDALLKDNVPRVREVGVQCVCRVLSVYLELVPLHTATSFLGTLIKHLSMDSSAAAVRVAVLRGLAVVLDNHVSHALLAARLPLLAERIHDSCESVRVAMAELLLKVRGVKGIRFFDVVALPDILSRLAADAGRPAVAKRLTKLLMPSYMPLNKPGAERLARILALVQQDQQAAQVFLREAGAEAPAQEALKLLSLMRHALARHLGHESEVAESPLKRKGKARESQASPHTVDIQVVEGLVLCMSALAQSLRRGVDDMPQAGEAKQQEEAGEVRQELAQALAGQCDRLHALVAADSSLPLSLEARCAVWSLLALGGSGIGQEGGDAGMERFVINAWRRGGALEMQAAMQCVLSLPPEAGAESRASLTKSLLLPLTTGVKHYLESVEGGKLCDSNKACKQRKTGKHKAASSVQPREVEASSGYGIEVLERIKALLACSSLRKRLLASPSSLSGLVKAFDGLRPLLEARLGMSGEAPAPVPGLEQAVELYGSLLLHLQCAQYPGEAGAGKAPQGLCAFIDTLVRSAPPASADPGDSSELWRQTASAVLLVCADACALNRCDQALAGGMCSLIQKVPSTQLPACVEAHASCVQVLHPTHASFGSCLLCPQMVHPTAKKLLRPSAACAFLGPRAGASLQSVLLASLRLRLKHDSSG